jgi:hypothetical protein
MGSRDKSLKLRAIDRDGQLSAVAAAKAARVQRYIYVSVSPTLQPPAPLVKYKRSRACRARKRNALDHPPALRLHGDLARCAARLGSRRRESDHLRQRRGSAQLGIRC